MQLSLDPQPERRVLQDQFDTFPCYREQSPARSETLPAAAPGEEAGATDPWGMDKRLKELQALLESKIAGAGLEKSIDVLLAMLERHTPESNMHILNVVTWTERLANVFCLSHAAIHKLRIGALLHDIGKLLIPEAILLKPGPLTEEEWGVMRQHPEMALRLLSPFSCFFPYLEIPYCHHERWDGSGYPEGLKRMEIPFSARLFAIVDVWDALTSDRVYRKAWSFDRAWNYIANQSGAHFDPQIVEKFLIVVKS